MMPEEGSVFTIRKCALCDEPATTTAVHVPVCIAHHDAYAVEAAKYLPTDQRPVYNSLLIAKIEGMHS